MQSKSKKLLFLLLALALVVGLLEAFLSLAAAASPRVARLLFVARSEPRILEDPRLGHIPNPAAPGGDARGYRNPAVLAAADVVALGDSQTYGTGVGTDDTWPRRLAEMTGRSVYSLAYPGYGPGHFLVQMDDALALHPATVVAAFYAGNDLFDSFNIVYNVGSLPDLRNGDDAVSAAVEAAEAADPIAERVTRLFAATANDEPDSFLSRHSRLYGLWRRLEREVARRAGAPAADRRWERAKQIAKKNPRYCELFEDGTFRTAFTPEYRLSALDLDDPRIAEGERISLEALSRMNRRAAAEGVRFLVVLIPTKELVFREVVTQPSAPYLRVVGFEEQLWSTTHAFLEAHGVDYVDALPALRARLAAGEQPYPDDHDGHPNALGHEAIAAAVAAHLTATPPAHVAEAAEPSRP